MTATGMPTPADDRQAVIDAIESMGRCYGQGDIEGVMTAYEPGAVVLFEPGVPTQGTQSLASAFLASLAVAPPFRLGAHEVVLAGDVALHLAPYAMRGRMPDGEAIEAEGLSVAVLRRQAGGVWRMLIDHPHAHLMAPPVPAGAPA